MLRIQRHVNSHWPLAPDPIDLWARERVGAHPRSPPPLHRWPGRPGPPGSPLLSAACLSSTSPISACTGISCKAGWTTDCRPPSRVSDSIGMVPRICISNTFLGDADAGGPALWETLLYGGDKLCLCRNTCPSSAAPRLLSPVLRTFTLIHTAKISLRPREGAGVAMEYQGIRWAQRHMHGTRDGNYGELGTVDPNRSGQLTGL